MDYAALAALLLGNMQSLFRARPHKNMAESLHGEAFVLNYIALQGAEVLPGDISQEMDVSSARVAAALNSLEKKGLITRQIAQNDRRKILVGITPKGEELAQAQYQVAVDETAKMLALLGYPDAKEYVRITGKLANALSKDQNRL